MQNAPPLFANAVKFAVGFQKETVLFFQELRKIVKDRIEDLDRGRDFPFLTCTKTTDGIGDAS